MNTLSSSAVASIIMDSTTKSEKDQHYHADDARTPKKKSQKRKDKKLRKRSINSDELKKNVGIDTHLNNSGANHAGGSKKSKHSHENDSKTPTPTTTSPDQVSNEHVISTADTTKTKKKKKSKKKAKRSKKSTDEVQLGDDEPSSDTNNVLLEGEMVGDTMVLVDKINGIVFSALDCNEKDGSRIQIGSYLNGQVTLFSQGDGTLRAEGKFLIFMLE